MGRIRERLTYANVMSTIAVFLVLGGASAFAAAQLGKNSVGPRQLKKNAVTAGKIKRAAVTKAKLRKNAVTGAKVRDGSLRAADIDLSSFPPVPSAVSAGNANTVGGQSAQKLFTTLGEGQANVTVASVAGFTVSASCNADDADVAVSGPTGAGFVLQSAGVWPKEANRTTGQYEASKPGEGGSIRIDQLTGEGSGDATFGVSSLAASTSAGATVSGTIGYDFDTFFGTPPNTCVVYGHLLAG